MRKESRRIYFNWRQILFLNMRGRGRKSERQWLKSCCTARLHKRDDQQQQQIASNQRRSQCTCHIQCNSHAPQHFNQKPLISSNNIIPTAHADLCNRILASMYWGVEEASLYVERGLLSPIYLEYFLQEPSSDQLIKIFCCPTANKMHSIVIPSILDGMCYSFFILIWMKGTLSIHSGTATVNVEQMEMTCRYHQHIVLHNFHPGFS